MNLTIGDLSVGLIDYIGENSLTEAEVVELINYFVPQQTLEKINNIDNLMTTQERQIEDVTNNVNDLRQKVLDILEYLDLSNNSNVDDVGYWYDDLKSGENIAYIENITLDTARQRLFGAPGNVIFKNLGIPFTSDEVKIQINMDNNFIESISEFSASIGDTEITVSNYTYKVE